MPTHKDYPWEQDARRAREVARSQGRRGSSQGNAPAAAICVAAIAAMLYGGFTIAGEPDPYRAPPAPVAAVQPSVKSTITGRLQSQRSTPRSVSWPVRAKSRMTVPGIVEVWGSTPAPDGATVTVFASRTRGGRRFRLDRAPVRSGHFVVRATLPQALRGSVFWVSARATAR